MHNRSFSWCQELLKQHGAVFLIHYAFKNEEDQIVTGVIDHNRVLMNRAFIADVGAEYDASGMGELWREWALSHMEGSGVPDVSPSKLTGRGSAPFITLESNKYGEPVLPCPTDIPKGYIPSSYHQALTRTFLSMHYALAMGLFETRVRVHWGALVSKGVRTFIDEDYLPDDLAEQFDDPCRIGDKARLAMLMHWWDRQERGCEVVFEFSHWLRYRRPPRDHEIHPREPRQLAPHIPDQSDVDNTGKNIGTSPVKGRKGKASSKRNPVKDKGSKKGKKVGQGKKRQVEEESEAEDTQSDGGNGSGPSWVGTDSDGGDESDEDIDLEELEKYKEMHAQKIKAFKAFESNSDPSTSDVDNDGPVDYDEEEWGGTGDDEQDLGDPDSEVQGNPDQDSDAETRDEPNPPPHHSRQPTRKAASSRDLVTPDRETRGNRDPTSDAESQPEAHPPTEELKKSKSGTASRRNPDSHRDSDQDSDSDTGGKATAKKGKKKPSSPKKPVIRDSGDEDNPGPESNTDSERKADPSRRRSKSLKKASPSKQETPDSGDKHNSDVSSDAEPEGNDDPIPGKKPRKPTLPVESEQQFKGKKRPLEEDGKPGPAKRTKKHPDTGVIPQPASKSKETRTAKQMASTRQAKATKQPAVNSKSTRSSRSRGNDSPAKNTRSHGPTKPTLKLTSPPRAKPKPKPRPVQKKRGTQNSDEEDDAAFDRLFDLRHRGKPPA